MSSPTLETAVVRSIGVKEFLRIFYPLLVLVAALEVLLWVHWNSLDLTALQWDNPKYSHGYLVPMFAAVLLWLRRDESQPIIQPVAVAGGVLLGIGALICLMLIVSPDFAMLLGNSLGKSVTGAIGVALAIPGVFLLIQPRFDFAAVPQLDRWIGLAILVAAEALRVFATIRSSFTPELFSIVPAVAGVFIMTGGLAIMKWAGWAIVFLTFMLPLPAQLDSLLAGNLQNVATRASTFLLQTIGIPARHQGNNMFVGADESQMTVAEACSGLRMLTIFGALSFAVALLCDRPLWQRIVIVLSSIPIALIVNVVRITLTGVMFAMLPGDHEELRHLGHTMWGLVMMPMALGLLFIEYKILVNLLVEDDDDIPPPLTGSQPSLRSKGPTPVASGAEISGDANSSIAKQGNGAPGGSKLPAPSASRPPRHRTPN